MKIDADVEKEKQLVGLRDLLKELRTIMRAESGDMQEHLQAIVALISGHFGSQVCSLYQTDERDGSLVLKATKGLRMEAVGRTRLRPGEGLVGTVAETRRLLALENAQADGRFVFRPETGEDEGTFALEVVEPQPAVELAPADVYLIAIPDDSISSFSQKFT